MYLTNFKNREDIEKEYDTELADDIEILLAWYGYGSYCGSSFVLFKQDGKLYEVNASHCSCNELEGQWKPEETSVEVLEKVLKEGTKFSTDYGDEGEPQANMELIKLIETLKNAQN